MKPAPPRPRPQAIDHHDQPVHRRRAARLTGPGIPSPPAQAAADHVHRHQVATPVRHGRPPRLAPQILS